MTQFGSRSLAILALLLFLQLASNAAPVTFGSWTAESYPAVADQPPGVWTVSPGADAVSQSVNGQPTLFYSDFNAMGSSLRGIIRVASDWDDDYMGFALGFRPGDTTNGAASFLLIDWRQGDQFHDFQAPSNTPGTTALRGLAVSRVTGTPTADEFWGHTNFASDSGGSVVELARGATLGNVGYLDDTDYEFQFVFLPNSLQVFVDNVLQLSIAGSFSDGRFAFYNFSQGGVDYSAFTTDPPPPPPEEIPEPATGLLLASSLLLIGAARMRRTA